MSGPARSVSLVVCWSVCCSGFSTEMVCKKEKTVTLQAWFIIIMTLELTIHQLLYMYARIDIVLLKCSICVAS